MTALRRTLPLALLAVALLLPAGAAAADRAVAVNGSVTQKVPNDSAGLGFSVSAERKTRGAALRQVAARLRAVIAATQTIPGVGAGDLTTGRITVRRVSPGKAARYRAAEGISVILHQPEKAGEVVDAAIAAGATGTSGPNFFIGDSSAAYGQALVAAFEQAKGRAAALAAAAGATLGQALTIEEGGGVSTEPVEKAISGAGACQVQTDTTAGAPVAKRCAAASPPVKPGTSTVTATVHVVFALL